MRKFWIVYSFKTDGSTFLPKRFDVLEEAEGYAIRAASKDRRSQYIVFESVSFAIPEMLPPMRIERTE